MKLKNLCGYVLCLFIGSAAMFVIPTSTNIPSSAQVAEFIGVIGMGFGLCALITTCVILRHIKETQQIDLNELNL